MRFLSCFSFAKNSLLEELLLFSLPLSSDDGRIDFTAADNAFSSSVSESLIGLILLRTTFTAGLDSEATKFIINYLTIVNLLLKTYKYLICCYHLHYLRM